MGMFYSFYIELDGKDFEVQSKRFDCCLDHYRIGDCVGGAASGVRVYFDTLDLDAAGKPVYGSPERTARSLTLFLVLVQGVFVEYDLVAGRLDPPEIQQHIRDLRELWSDSARLVDFLVDRLRERQQTIAVLQGRIASAASAITSTRRLRAGENLNTALGLFREEDQRLTRGDDPLDVIEWALNEGSAWGFGGGSSTPADPLADYRL